MDDRLNREAVIGAVTGLAVLHRQDQEVGGDTILIQVSCFAGSPTVQVTGIHGPVLRDSVRAVYNLVRARFRDWGPRAAAQGAAGGRAPGPYCGAEGRPSAGLAFVAGIVSALTERAVKPGFALPARSPARRGRPGRRDRPQTPGGGEAGRNVVIVPATNANEALAVGAEVGVEVHAVGTIAEVAHYAWNRPAIRNRAKHRPLGPRPSRPPRLPGRDAGPWDRGRGGRDGRGPRAGRTAHWSGEMMSDSASSSRQAPRGWHNRGYLPHFDAGPVIQTVTFRLAYSLPVHVVDAWQAELRRLPENRRAAELRTRAGSASTKGTAPAPSQPGRRRNGRRARASISMANGIKCSLGWSCQTTSMPCSNLSRAGHCLPFCTPGNRSHRIEPTKSFGDQERFWHPDCFDRFIRDEDHFRRALVYIEDNPVKAGLCARPIGRTGVRGRAQPSGARQPLDRGRPGRKTRRRGR